VGKNGAMAGESQKMPQVHHLTLEEAQQTLKAEGLSFKLALMQSKAVPEGELIAVTPLAGSSVEHRSEVVLTVSSGPPTPPKPPTAGP
jgi:beta-lactam-binding protein with PASTA domain